MSGLFVDISGYQISVNWSIYKAWSASLDGVSRVAIKSSEGVGFTDPLFHQHYQAALSAGINVIWLYHFARPGLGNTAQAEADWQKSVVGVLRPQDALVLDIEESMPEATAAWTLAWLERQAANYSGKLPILYASTSYIQQRLTDARLAKYPLWLANWTFSPDKQPASPAPWKRYVALQWSDAEAVPGVSGTVDANVSIGGGGSLAELKNFPVLSQLTDVTGDAKPSENALYDCVPASIAMCIAWYRGLKAWTTTLNPDVLKDAVYGDAYAGAGTSAADYRAYIAGLGYTLASTSNSSNVALVAQTHQFLKKSIPVLYTETDPYGPGTHVCVFYGEVTGGLKAADPFIAETVIKSDAEWEAIMQFNEIWTVEKEEDLSIHSDFIERYFDTLADGRIAVKPGHAGAGIVIQDDGALTFYKACAASLRLPMTNEHTIGNVTWQRFEAGVLIIKDPKHEGDSTSAPYVLKVDSALYKKLIIQDFIDVVSAAAEAEKAALQSQLNTAMAQVNTLIEQLKAASPENIKQDIVALQSLAPPVLAAIEKLTADLAALQPPA